MRNRKWLIASSVVAVAVAALLVAAWRIKSIDIPLISEPHGSRRTAVAAAGGVQESAVQQCVDRWNSGHFVQYDHRHFLAEAALGKTEGQAVVTRDPRGVCVVAFPEIVGSEASSLEGYAYTYSYERGAWDLYILIDHEEAPLDPAAAEAQRSQVNERARLMEELERRVWESPNARLSNNGYLALLGEAVPAAPASEGGASAPVECGSISLREHSDFSLSGIQATGLECSEALAILHDWVSSGFQGDPEGFSCETTPTPPTGMNGTIVHCTKGTAILDFTSY